MSVRPPRPQRHVLRPIPLLATALLLASGALAQSTDPIPLEPDFDSVPSDNAPITLEEDLAAPAPPPGDGASQVDPAAEGETDIPDDLGSLDALPSEPFTTLPGPEFGIPGSDAGAEELTAPSPLDPVPARAARSFAPDRPNPPAADESQPFVDADEESTAAVAAANAADLFRMDGAKIRIAGVDLRFSLDTRFTYNDNILTTESDPIADVVSFVTPGLLVGIGDFQDQRLNYFLLQYQPTLQNYADNSELNAVDQFFTIGALYGLSRFTVSPSFRYIQQTDTDDEIGRRNERTTTIASLATTYALSGKTALQSELSAAYYESELGVNNTVYSGSLFLAYALTGRTELSIGSTVGYVDVENGDYQTFETLTARIGYSGFDKIEFLFTAGAEARQSTSNQITQSIVATDDPLVPFEFRQETNTETSGTITPIFELGATYRPFQETSITLTAYRRQQASSFQAGQVIDQTGLRLDASHRVYRQFSLALLASYELSEYTFRSSNDRQDNVVVFQPRIRYDFNDDDYSVSLFYTYRENQSTISSVSYVNSILGMEFNFDF